MPTPDDLCRLRIDTSGLKFGESWSTVIAMKKHMIFISSAQKELAEERQTP